MKIKFATWFTVEVENGYFGSGRWSGVSITPLPETRQWLQKNGCLTRKIDHALHVLLPINDQNKPLVPPDAFEKLSFVLEAPDGQHTYFTHLPEGECLYFHNRHGHTANGLLYLTHPLPAYAQSQAYVPGNLVTGAGGSVYESIQANAAGAGSIPANDTHPQAPAYWAKWGLVPYVSPADTRLEHQGQTYTIHVCGDTYRHTATENPAQHSIALYTYVGALGGYYKPVKRWTAAGNTPGNTVTVNLQGIPEGCYILRVNQDIQPLYISSRAQKQTMRVDIFNLPPGHTHALLAANGSLNSPRFHIAFAARRTWWRYKTLTDTIDRIVDGSGTYQFTPSGNRCFISEQPIPLSDMPLKTLVAKSGDIKICEPLPNPQPQRLTDSQNERYTVESFLQF